eukprot:13264039-Alexandrium_andersonii.AAC.1
MSVFACARLCVRVVRQPTVGGHARSSTNTSPAEPRLNNAAFLHAMRACVLAARDTALALHPQADVAMQLPTRFAPPAE